MDKISGNALWGSIKNVTENNELTDKQKLYRIKFALELYEYMNTKIRGENR